MTPILTSLAAPEVVINTISEATMKTKLLSCKLRVCIEHHRVCGKKSAMNYEVSSKQFPKKHAFFIDIFLIAFLILFAIGRIWNPWWRHQIETFSALLTICAENYPHKGQWRGALMFSLICVWKNGWVNNREAGDLRRYRAHYDVTVIHDKIVPHKCLYKGILSNTIEIFKLIMNQYGAKTKYSGITRSIPWITVTS